MKKSIKPALKSVTRPNNPDRVILHCSATPDYPFDSDDYDRFRIKHLRDWHKQRGFQDVGYHFCVSRSGIIEAGRFPTVIGAHCQGYNQDSLGVCWIGTQYPTGPQIRELLNLYVLIHRSWKIGWENWIGHHELNPDKLCPGFSMDVFRELLRYHHAMLLLKQESSVRT